MEIENLATKMNTIWKVFLVDICIRKISHTTDLDGTRTDLANNKQLEDEINPWGKYICKNFFCRRTKKKNV